MKTRRSLTTAGMSVLILLAAVSVLFAQVPEGGVATPADSNEPMSADVPSSRVLVEHPPVELADLRDDHTRVWEVVREVETTEPSGTTTVETVTGRVIEKGSGICYRNEVGNLLPSNPHWEATANGFVLRECAYGLSAGKTLAVPILYSTRGAQLFFRPALLKASHSATEELVAAVDTAVEGVVDAQDPRRLVFPGAFGTLGDVEILAEKGALHQNLILRNPAELKVDSRGDDGRLSLYTELSLDAFLSEEGARVELGSDVIAGAGIGPIAERSKTAPIAFYREESASDGTHKDVLEHFFAESVVYAASAGKAAAVIGERAERTLFRDPESNVTYLVESVAVSALRDTTYPLVWDFWSIPQDYQEGEPWVPACTYRVTADFYVSSGTLVILPGTLVKLDPYVSIYIGPGAAVVAKGEPYDYITFTRTRDDNCGEIISGVQDLPYACALYLMDGSSPDSIVQYCKMGKGYFGINCVESLNQPIAHNIIRGGNALWIGIIVQFGATTSCWNNLVTGSTWLGIQYYEAHNANTNITNNTVDGANVGIQLQYSNCALVTDNLLANCGAVGISVSSTPVGLLDHDGFWRCKTPVSGAQKGPNSVVLGYYNDPYDPCSVGEFYLDHTAGEGAELRDRPGGRTAEAAGLAGAQFTVNKPNVAPVSITSNATWAAIASDTGIVDIGYHHNRVDWLLNDADTTVTNAALIIQPGTVVAVHGYGRALRAGTAGRLICIGDRQAGKEVIISSKRSVSMAVDASLKFDPLPNFNELQVGVLLQADSSFASEVRDTTFRGLHVGVAAALRTAAPIWGSRFFACQIGIYADDGLEGRGLPDVANNLFSNCYDCVQLRSYFDSVACLRSNTFDTCRFAVRMQGRGDWEGAPVFYIYDSLFTRVWECAITWWESERICFWYDIDHCGFWDYLYDLGNNLWDTNRVPITSCPYQGSGAAYGRWFLNQSSPAVNGTWYDPASLGLGPHTTAVDGSLDDGLADIGYHYPSPNPPAPPADAPWVTIVQPVAGSVVEGVATVELNAGDTLGDNPGVLEVDLFWNGQRVSVGEPDPDDPARFLAEWPTNGVANGLGVLQAVAVDHDHMAACSAGVQASVDNLVTFARADRSDLDPTAGQTLRVAAVLSHPAQWALTIVDPEEEDLPAAQQHPIAHVASGTGAYVAAEWDGRDDGGQIVADGPYTHQLEALGSWQRVSDGVSVSSIFVTDVQAVLFAPFGRSVDRKLFRRLSATLATAGIRTKSFFKKDASWLNLKDYVQSNPNCYLFVYSGHGFRVEIGGVWVGLGFFVGNADGYETHTYDTFAHADAEKAQGYPFAVESLGLRWSGQLKLVWMDCCRCGAMWPPESELPTQPSDMAMQFGSYSGAGDQAYVGFKGKVWDLDKLGFTDVFFDHLVREDNCVSFAIDLTVNETWNTRRNRCEQVQDQGYSSLFCKIPPTP